MVSRSRARRCGELRLELRWLRHGHSDPSPRQLHDHHAIRPPERSPEKGLMVMGGSDMWLHVVDVNSGEEVDVCKGHHGPIHTVQFRPGGSTFASGSEDGTIRIWSA